MKLRVISVGNKCPVWIRQGFDEYAKRLPREMPLSLIEVPAPRHHQDSAKVDEYEAKKVAEKMNPSDWVVAMDEAGQQLDSKGMSAELNRWRDMGRDIVFLIGGANGLSPDLLDRADQRLSLSALTFPHYMVRVLLAVCLYRALTIHIGHSYHRD